MDTCIKYTTAVPEAKKERQKKKNARTALLLETTLIFLYHVSLCKTQNASRLLLNSSARGATCSAFVVIYISFSRTKNNFDGVKLVVAI